MAGIGAYFEWDEINPRTKKLIKKQTLFIDILLEENLTKDAEATTFPIEIGANPADHHRPHNAKLSLSCYFLAIGTPIKHGGVIPDSLIDSQRFDDDSKLYNILDGLRLNSNLISYVTPKRRLDNLLLTSLKYSHTALSGRDALKMTIDLEQQTFVGLKRVKIKKAVPKNNMCEGPKDAGTKTAQPTEPEQQKQLRSLWSAGAEKGAEVIFGKPGNAVSNPDVLE